MANCAARGLGGGTRCRLGDDKPFHAEWAVAAETLWPRRLRKYLDGPSTSGLVIAAGGAFAGWLLEFLKQAPAYAAV